MELDLTSFAVGVVSNAIATCMVLYFDQWLMERSLRRENRK